MELTEGWILGASPHCQNSINEWPQRANRMNAINVIWPYKHHGMWVFDDARVGRMRTMIRRTFPMPAAGGWPFVK
jgi:hypothetical protein